MKFKTLIINAEIAEEYGYPTAVMLHHISYWVEHNKMNKKCKNESVYWMYRTYEDLASEYPGFTGDIVKNAIDKLVKAKIVAKRPFFIDGKKINHYHLTDKGKEYSAKFRKENGKLYINYEKLAQYRQVDSPAGGGKNTCSDGDFGLSIIYVKKYKTKNLSLKGTGVPPADIIGVMSAFKPIQVKINYGNTTQRAAAADLIGAFGAENAKEMAKQAVIITQYKKVATPGYEFAPTVYNPVDLRDKLASIQNFINNKQAEINKPKSSIDELLEEMATRQDKKYEGNNL